MTRLSHTLATVGLACALLSPSQAAAHADPAAAPAVAAATSAPTPATSTVDTTAGPAPTEAGSPAPAATPGSPSAEPDPGDSDPTAEPSSACEQDPVICQDQGPPPQPATTTDCGQVHGNGLAASAAPETVCLAEGVAPGSDNGASRPQLPRTGPASLVPGLVLAGSLLLLGALAVLAGRRRPRWA